METLKVALTIANGYILSKYNGLYECSEIRLMYNTIIIITRNKQVFNVNELTGLFMSNPPVESMPLDWLYDGTYEKLATIYESTDSIKLEHCKVVFKNKDQQSRIGMN